MQAYTYYLTHVPTGKFYIGSRCRNIYYKRLPEEDFWIYYFTSSKKVRKLLDEYGKESFSYKIVYRQIEEDEPDRFWWYEQELILENLDNPLCLNGCALDRKTGKRKFSTFGISPTSQTRQKISQKIKYSYEGKSEEEKLEISKKKSENTKRIHENRSQEEKDRIYLKMLDTRKKWSEEEKLEISKKRSDSIKKTLAKRSPKELEIYRKKQADIGWNLKSEEEKQKLREQRSRSGKESWARRKLHKQENNNTIKTEGTTDDDIPL